MCGYGIGYGIGRNYRPIRVLVSVSVSDWNQNSGFGRTLYQSKLKLVWTMISQNYSTLVTIGFPICENFLGLRACDQINHQAHDSFPQQIFWSTLQFLCKGLHSRSAWYWLSFFRNNWLQFWLFIKLINFLWNHVITSSVILHLRTKFSKPVDSIPYLLDLRILLLSFPLFFCVATHAHVGLAQVPTQKKGESLQNVKTSKKKPWRLSSIQLHSMSK